MRPTARAAPVSLAVAATVVLSGCASSLSVVGSTQGYACKAPVGAQCTSVSGVYANNARPDVTPYASRAVHEAPLATQSVRDRTPAAEPSRKVQSPDATSALMATGAAEAPRPAALRSAPRVIRLWIAPWEDADGDLHEASLVHVVVDTGRWLIERVRPAPRSKLDLATPPLTPPAAVAPIPETRSQADFEPSEP